RVAHRDVRAARTDPPHPSAAQEGNLEKEARPAAPPVRPGKVKSLVALRSARHAARDDADVEDTLQRVELRLQADVERKAVAHTPDHQQPRLGSVGHSAASLRISSMRL